MRRRESGRDILVQQEEVHWVLCLLQCGQPLVRSRVVGRFDALLPLVAQEAEIHPAGRERLHRCIVETYWTYISAGI
jgi:hypothetical protein